MMHSELLRLLVVDPDPETSGAVQEALRSRNDIYFLAQCATALEAVPILREPGADIVLCEAELPGVSGFSLSEFLPSTKTTQINLIQSFAIITSPPNDKGA